LDCHGIGTCEMWGKAEGNRIIPIDATGRCAQWDYVTLMGLLNAWASIVVLEEGRYSFGQIIQSGHESDVFVWTSLVDMFAIYGSTASWYHFLFVFCQPHNNVGLVDEGMECCVSMIRLHEFCKIGTLHLHGGPCWPCCHI
jgi:hypothetical protein